MPIPSLRRCLLALLAVCLLSGQVFATWSIVVVNRRTGEICVASATCIEDFNLRTALSIMSAEAGGGAAQAFVSPVSTRILINDLLALGVPPHEILDRIEETDGLFQSRQFGIVDLAGRAVTFSGSQNFQHASGVTGEIGDLVYAIQGNILTGAPVITEAEAALRNTPGDLGQKVMAAMEAARDMGGDGRCSCDEVMPESCGAPPPQPYKSAHVGFLILARPGDAPFCNAFGCGLGDLYMIINKAGLDATDPDVVDEIRIKFNQLRLDLDDRPDGNYSSVFAYEQEVAAGSTSPLSFVLDLADVDGDPILHGGATISVEHDPTSAGSSTFLQYTDHQDGTYTVEMTPGAEAGLDVLRFVVDDGIRPVVIWPPTKVLHHAPAPAPLTPSIAVPGLGSLTSVRSAFPAADGLSAWILGGRGSGLELMLAERADLLSPFAITSDVGITHFALDALQDFWLSADGLRMTLAALDAPGGIVRLYSTSRASTLEDFEEPILLVDLDDATGAGGPWLSSNEREIWFHSARDGQLDLWHATRLSAEARWFPPTKLATTSTDADEYAPMLDQGDTRLVFSRGATAPEAPLFSARRNFDGSFPAATALAGTLPSALDQVVAVGSLPHASGGDAEFWFLDRPTPGLGRLRQANTTAGSLEVSPSSVSLVSGGSFHFQLQANSTYANSEYLLLIGEPTAGTFLKGVGTLPILRRGFSDRLFAMRTQPELADVRGQLDGSGAASANLQVTAGLPLPA
ncbi:MAG: DUF1028 domain-containing protein, partial [Planctomycetota bacterium]